ncbi:MAG TPA: hypothetical protein DDW27_09175 [Bacteroidales bacterium]|nr:hypothetical protein [Bacteroidales bacterium]
MERLFTSIVIFALIINVNAQSPQKMSYQAVIRNAGGALLPNQNVGIRIQILQGSEYGAAVYVETHTRTTNANGLATLEIGGGTVVLGSFSGINCLGHHRHQHHKLEHCLWLGKPLRVIPAGFLGSLLGGCDR